MPQDVKKEHPALTGRPEDKSLGKVERALKIREGVAAARKGKPIAFPTHRMRP